MSDASGWSWWHGDERLGAVGGLMEHMRLRLADGDPAVRDGFGAWLGSRPPLEMAEDVGRMGLDGLFSEWVMDMAEADGLEDCGVRWAEGPCGEEAME